MKMRGRKLKAKVNTWYICAGEIELLAI